MNWLITSPRRRTRLWSLLWVGAGGAWMLGCGAGEPTENVRVASQQAFDDGQQALDRHQYESAEEHFTRALEQGGISPDQAAEALVLRATARLQLQQYQAALEDLASAEEGVDRAERIHLLRGRVFKAQGRSDEAKVEYQKARVIDPDLGTPTTEDGCRVHGSRCLLGRRLG